MYMRTPLNTVKTVAIIVICTLCSNAQNLHWTQSKGVDGGTVNALLSLGSGQLLAGTDVGLFYSSDEGNHWEARGIKAATVLSLVSDGSAIYAGIGYSSEDGSGGVFRSLDDGITWTKNLTSEYVWCVSARPGLIVVGTDGNGVFSSPDGAAWTQGIAGHSVYALTMTSNAVYAATDSGGVFKSTDNAKTWSVSGLTKRGGFYALTSNSVAVFAGGDVGVFRSADEGKTWTSAGLNGETVYSLATDGTTLYVGTDTSGVVSRKGAAAWVYSDLGYESVYALCLTDTKVVAGTLDDGVFVSADQAKSFIDASTELTAVPIYCFDMGDTYYAGGNGICMSTDKGHSWSWLDYYGLVYTIHDFKGTLLVGTDDGYYASPDKGLNWTQYGLSGEIVYSDAFDESTGLLFAGTVDHGVYLSKDTGRTWTQTAVDTGTVNCLLYGRTGLYAGMEDGRLLHSIDDAKTWKTVFHDSLNPVRAFDELENRLLIVGTYGNDISRSVNVGQDWMHYPLNSILQTDVTAVVGGGGKISAPGPMVGCFAGTYGNGVFGSNNDGEFWSAENNGISNPFILSMWGAGSDALLAGTEGGGIFYTVVPTAVPDGAEVTSHSITLWPQPVNNVLVYSIENQDPHDIQLSIVNSIGECVYNMQEQPIMNSVEAQCSIETSALPNGVYTFIVHNGSRVYSSRFVILHE